MTAYDEALRDAHRAADLAFRMAQQRGNWKAARLMSAAMTVIGTVRDDHMDEPRKTPRDGEVAA